MEASLQWRSLTNFTGQPLHNSTSMVFLYSCSMYAGLLFPAIDESVHSVAVEVKGSTRPYVGPAVIKQCCMALLRSSILSYINVCIHLLVETLYH